MDSQAAKSLIYSVDLPDGTRAHDTLGSLDTVLYQYCVNTCIFGGGIAAFIILSVLLVMVARSYKSVLFWMHQTNFLLGLLQYSFQIRIYMEPFHQVSGLVAAYEPSKNVRNVAVAVNFISFVFYCSLLACLGFQVYTAVKDLQKWLLKWGSMVLYGLAYFQSVFILMWGLVVSVRNEFSSPDQYSESWAYNALWPSFAATSTVGSFILSWRLFCVCRSRAKLGLEEFSALHMILVMAMQNATVPAIFAIVYACVSRSGSTIPEAVGLLTTMLSGIFYPVGYIWAQTKLRTSDDASECHAGPMIKKSIHWSAPESGSHASWHEEEEKAGFTSQTREYNGQ